MKGKELFDKFGAIREDFVQDTANSLYGEGERNEEAGEGKTKLFHGGRWIHGSQAKSMGKERKRWYLPCGAAAAVVFLVGAIYAKEYFFMEDKGSVNIAENQQDTDLANDVKKNGQEFAKKDENSAKIEKGGASAGEEPDVCQVQSVSYPEQIDWLNDDGWDPDGSYLKSLKNFYQDFFKGTLISETQENTACSPVNLYLCMAMLTEMTSGKTQTELLDALGQSSVETVREQSRKLAQGIIGIFGYDVDRISNASYALFFIYSS